MKAQFIITSERDKFFTHLMVRPIYLGSPNLELAVSHTGVDKLQLVITEDRKVVISVAIPTNNNTLCVCA